MQPETAAKQPSITFHGLCFIAALVGTWFGLAVLIQWPEVYAITIVALCALGSWLVLRARQWASVQGCY
jgi:hypothetical protein